MTLKIIQIMKPAIALFFIQQFSILTRKGNDTFTCFKQTDKETL